MTFPEKIQLTAEQEAYLRKHYKHTPNAEVMAKTGLKHSTLHRFVKQLGLKKTPQFMHKCWVENSKLAWLVNRAKGYPPKGYVIPNRHPGFQKGQSNKDRLSPKRWAEAKEKRRLTWLKNREADKRRVLFGLEQKTKFRITKQPKSKMSYRSTMKKHGYIEIKGDKNVLYYPNEAMRHPIAESHASRHNIKILPLTQQKIA